MPQWIRWFFGLTIAVLLAAVPITYYRAEYTNHKRLREVSPGQVYRSGQLTQVGFVDAVKRYGIRTIINLQSEHPDPDVPKSFFNRETIKESEMCRQLGVKFVSIFPHTIPRRALTSQRPEAVDQFLKVLDDPVSYPRPLLIHCKAGLHRTGIMVAIYRMEKEGWSRDEAIREMKANGFGEWGCTSANDYVYEYVLTYQPGIRAASWRNGAGIACEESGTRREEDGR